MPSSALVGSRFRSARLGWLGTALFGAYRVGRHGHRLIFCWEPQVCIKSSWNFHSIMGKCIKINVASVHFSVNTLFKYKTTFEVTDPPARASHHVMAMGGTVPYFIDLWNREMKSDWFKFRLKTFLKIEWMTHRLYKIEITFSIQAISKEVHGCAARRVKTYGIPVKLRILPPDVGSENEPFRPDTVRLSCSSWARLGTLFWARFGSAQLSGLRARFSGLDSGLVSRLKTRGLGSTLLEARLGLLKVRLS